MSLLTKLEEKYLLAPKILYFVVNMQYYTLHQFRPAFAKNKFHVSDGDYGKFTGIIMFITFFTNIIVGGVSDKTRKPKAVLLFLTIITAFIFYVFYVPNFMDISHYTFWLVLFFYLVFNNPKQPLLDKIILDYLGKMSAGPNVYGKQGMWGSIAYGIATYVSECCLLQGSTKDSKDRVEYNFNNMIYYSLIATAIATASIMFLTSEQRTQPEEIEDPKLNEVNEQQQQQSAQEEVPERNILKEYVLLLKNGEFLFFMGIIFSNAITRSAMSFYLTSYQENILGLKPYKLPDSWPDWLRDTVALFNNKPIAALTFFGLVFEVLVMFISESILCKLGFFWPLLIAQLCSVVRFFAYYMIPANGAHVYCLCCLFEFIKGIYFGLAHISSVQIATRLAPPHLKAISQMIYQGTFTALGSLIGGYLFGHMFNSVPSDDDGSAREAVFRQIFMINGFVAFLTILVYFYKYGVKDKALFSREAEEAKLNAAAIEVESM